MACPDPGLDPLGGLNARVAFSNEGIARIAGLLESQNDLLRRLVELEEERRNGERNLEALAESLMPGGGDLDPEAIDWFRRDGTVLVREGGAERAPTQSEAKALSAIGAFQQRSRR